MNVIHVVAHDLGRDLGCYGRPVHTPNLDRFARHAFRFTDAHATAVCCSPSRACAMTGLYPHRNGVMGLSHHGWEMPEATATLVDWFNEAGVETVHSGFQHERHAYADNRYAVELASRQEDHLVQNAISHAITYLSDRRSADRPFYLNVGTLETHPSAWGAERQISSADPLRLEQCRRYQPFCDGESTPSLCGQPYPQTYRASIGFFDHEIARLIDAVDRLGLGRDTWIIITTDHGAAFGSRRKETLYHLGTELALLIRPPGGLERGCLIDAPTPNVNMAPTIAEMLDVAVPEAIDGRSFLPWLQGQVTPSHEPILGFRNFHGETSHDPVLDIRRSIREDGRLLLWRPAIEGRCSESLELFDTANDPACAVDLTRQPGTQDSVCAIARAMRESLEARLHACGDPIARGIVSSSARQLAREMQLSGVSAPFLKRRPGPTHASVARNRHVTKN